MEKTGSELINPLVLFKESVRTWRKNAVAVFALYCVIIFLGRTLKIFLLGWSGVPSVFFFVPAVLAVVFIDALLILMAIYFMDPRNKSRTTFTKAFEEARRRVIPCLKAFFLLLLFVGAMVAIGHTFIYWGRVMANSSTAKINILLTTHMAGVIFFIAAAWYGFSFSLGPLVAAFEQKDAWQALNESRGRVRGQALRYLCSMGFVVALYVAALWVSVYAVVGHFAHPRRILLAIDLVLQTVFVTLFFSVWLMNYLKLKE